MQLIDKPVDSGSSCEFCELSFAESDPEVCGRCGALIGTLRFTPEPELPKPSLRDVLYKSQAALVAVFCSVALIVAGHLLHGVSARVAETGEMVLLIAVSTVVVVGWTLQRKVDEENARRRAWNQSEPTSRRQRLEERRLQIVAKRRDDLATKIAKSRWDLAPAVKTDLASSDALSSSPDSLHRFDVVDVTGAAGLSTVELLWSWVRMDPDVIRAADFSLSGYHLDGRFDFVRWINAHYDHLSHAAQQGSFDRLLGYVGEQRYYDLMISHGSVVTTAAMDNQPLWDFVVDGHYVNVKTNAEVSSLHADAIQHPGIIYAVPQDASGHLDPNMVRVPGLSHHDLAHSLHHAIDAANGGDALSAFAHHLPVIALGRAALKGYAQVRAGQQASLAAKYGAIDVSTKTISAVMFAKTGLVVGHAGGPAGMAAGFAVGAAIGVFGGAKLANAVKTAPIKRGEARLNSALSSYWQSCKDDAASTLMAQLETELEARRTVETEARERANQVRSSRRWKYWPDMEDVAILELESLARAATKTCEEESRPLKTILRNSTLTGVEAETARHAAMVQLGVLLVNAPEMAELVGPDIVKLKEVAAARKKLTQAREDLDPGTTPLATAKAAIGKAKNEVVVLWYRTGWLRDSVYHDESAVLRGLTSSCPTLDATVKQLQGKGSRKTTDQMNKKASVAWAEVDGKISKNACPHCEPLLIEKLKRVLAEHPSPRPGWRVQLESASWACEKHGKTGGCPDCSTGWD